tara:strand:- start:134 stop:685 length:552 start_codon:yes stop_codon:yes gene_type:complete
MIHMSHSKKDLIELVERFQLYQITNYKELRKDKLARDIWSLLSEMDYVPPDNEIFYVDNIVELREILKKTSCKQITSNSVKYDVADRVKSLNYYVKGGFVFPGTPYETIDDVMVDAEFVRHFGDLPSVRRVIERLNQDVKTPVVLSAIMTRRVQQRVHKLIEQKTRNTPRFHTRRGNYTVVFL